MSVFFDCISMKTSKQTRPLLAVHTTLPVIVVLSLKILTLIVFWLGWTIHPQPTTNRSTRGDSEHCHCCSVVASSKWCLNVWITKIQILSTPTTVPHTVCCSTRHDRWPHDISCSTGVQLYHEIASLIARPDFDLSFLKQPKLVTTWVRC